MLPDSSAGSFIRKRIAKLSLRGTSPHVTAYLARLLLATQTVLCICRLCFVFPCASCLWLCRQHCLSSPSKSSLSEQMPDADGGATIADTDSLEAVAKLTRTNRYRDVMRRVRAALAAGVDAEEEQAWTGPSEESPTYR